jgi:hypothetical protein
MNIEAESIRDTAAADTRVGIAGGARFYYHAAMNALL